MASKGNPFGSSAVAIVAALIFPPLGVFLDSGIGRTFWITTILTMLFFVPGVIFALFSILKRRAATA